MLSLEEKEKKKLKKKGITFVQENTLEKMSGLLSVGGSYAEGGEGVGGSVRHKGGQDTPRVTSCLTMLRVGFA